jgi:hypothetical protein
MGFLEFILQMGHILKEFFRMDNLIRQHIMVVVTYKVGLQQSGTKKNVY